MLNIAVLVSGGGTNLQALFDAQADGTIQNGKIIRVIASNPNAYALDRAKQHGVEGVVVSRKTFASPAAYDQAILRALDDCHADLVVLAGFLSILGKEVIDRYPYRIINVHPSLIPSFCGAGYYGLKVHEAALAYGVKLTGATVHFVNEEADAGAIILQKSVAVRTDDTPDTLQKRVMEEAEWNLLPRAVSLFCQNKIEIIDGKAVVKE